MFITGWTDKDGNSICYEPMGMFINPDNEDEWSSMPYNKAQKKVNDKHDRFMKCFDRVTEHLSRTNRSIPEELELIKTKKSTLPRYAKNFLLEQI